jgi:hypothetical protein
MGDYADLEKRLRGYWGDLCDQDYLDAADAIASLTRELADARAECEGVASEAAKMLTKYLETRDAAIKERDEAKSLADLAYLKAGEAIETRDAAIARAEEWQKNFSVLSKAIVGETGASAIEEARKLVACRALLREAGLGLNEYKRAIGDHYAPDDCYATGPMTGNDYRDLVECPACSALKLHADLAARIAAATQTETGGEDE